MRSQHSKIDIDNAKRIAREYCIQHGLNIRSLEKQLIYVINGKTIFAQPSQCRANGLREDLDTQPKPTLIVEKSSRGYIVHTTEYTKYVLVQVEFENDVKVYGIQTKSSYMH